MKTKTIFNPIKSINNLILNIYINVTFNKTTTDDKIENHYDNSQQIIHFPETFQVIKWAWKNPILNGRRKRKEKRRKPKSSPQRKKAKNREKYHGREKTREKKREGKTSVVVKLNIPTAAMQKLEETRKKETFTEKKRPNTNPRSHVETSENRLERKRISIRNKQRTLKITKNNSNRWRKSLPQINYNA